MEKKLEDMTTEELLKVHFDLLKKLEFTPKKLNIGPDGTILLDPTDEDDRAWYGNDEE